MHHHLFLVSTLAGVTLSLLQLGNADFNGRGFTIAQSGGTENVIVTRDNTLNGSYHGRLAEAKTPNATNKHSLLLKLVNNYGGGAINAYVQGLDSDGAIVFVGAENNLIYPNSGGSPTPVEIEEDIAIPLPPQGESLTLNISVPLRSGRVYFCQGQLRFFMLDFGDADGLVQPSVSNLDDPSASLHWGFIELTYLDNGALYANISYVDFVGLILSMALSMADGSRPQITRGLRPDAVFRLCEGLWNQTASDGYLWLAMCVVDGSGSPVRVLSPNYYQRIYAADFQDYWQGYVDKVWEYYSSTPLVIDTQTPAGDIECQVFDDTLYCDDDNRGYAKPTAADIWGCNSGPFGLEKGDNRVHVAVIPRLCAAFVRSTLLVEGGDVQPGLGSSHHYRVSPTHHYSRIVHELQVDGRGYAFPYDDVNPDGHEDVSGLVSSGKPHTLTVYVGTPPTE